MRPVYVALALLITFGALGCGQSRNPTPTDAGSTDQGNTDQGNTDEGLVDSDAPSVDANDSDLGPVPTFCVADMQCQNGLYCDNAEHCDPTDALADGFGCVAAASGPCADPTRCDETMDRCATDCEVVPDADSDGHEATACGGDDCDDSRAAVNPDAPEICNGYDDNCDGVADDVDADGDGFITIACGGDDCDDVSIDRHPGATELCNGVDDDCDGAIDDGIPGVGTACGSPFFSCTPRRTCIDGALTCVGTVVSATGTAAGSGLPSDATTLGHAVEIATAMGGGDVCVVGSWDAPVPVAASVDIPPGVRVVGTDALGAARTLAYIVPAIDVRLAIEGTVASPAAIYDLGVKLLTTSALERINSRGNVTLDNIFFRGEWEFWPGVGIDVRGPAQLNNVYAVGRGTAVRVRGTPSVAHLTNVSGWGSSVALDLADVVLAGAIGVPNSTLTYGPVLISNASGRARLEVWHGWGGGGPTTSVATLSGDLTGLDLDVSGTMAAATGTLFYLRDCVGNPRITLTGARVTSTAPTTPTFVRVEGAFCAPTVVMDLDTRADTTCAPGGCTAIDCSGAPCAVESANVHSAGGMTALRCTNGGCGDIGSIMVDDTVGSAARPGATLVELNASNPRIGRGLLVRRTTIVDASPLVSIIDGQPQLTNVQLSRVGSSTAPVLRHETTSASATLMLSYCGLTQGATTAPIPALFETTSPTGAPAVSMSNSVLAFATGTPAGSLPMARFGADGAATFSRNLFGNANTTPLVGVGGLFLTTGIQVDATTWADGTIVGACATATMSFDCAFGVDAGNATGAPPLDRVLTARPLGSGFDIGPLELR